jgi:hypothetical protein
MTKFNRIIDDMQTAGTSPTKQMSVVLRYLDKVARDKDAENWHENADEELFQDLCQIIDHLIKREGFENVTQTFKECEKTKKQSCMFACALMTVAPSQPLTGILV